MRSSFGPDGKESGPVSCRTQSHVFSGPGSLTSLSLEFIRRGHGGDPNENTETEAQACCLAPPDDPTQMIQRHAETGLTWMTLFVKETMVPGS